MIPELTYYLVIEQHVCAGVRSIKYLGLFTDRTLAEQAADLRGEARPLIITHDPTHLTYRVLDRDIGHPGIEGFEVEAETLREVYLAIQHDFGGHPNREKDCPFCQISLNALRQQESKC